MSIITIVLNKCQGYLCPRCSRAARRYSVTRPLSVMRYSSQIRLRVCVCVCHKCLKGVRSRLAGSLSSEAGLGLGHVDLDAVGAFGGGVLPHGRRPLRRQQTLPGFLPLLVHGRVHAPVLPRWQLGLLLWHRWRKRLVFILRKRNRVQLKTQPRLSWMNSYLWDIKHSSSSRQKIWLKAQSFIPYKSANYFFLI